MKTGLIGKLIDYLSNFYLLFPLLASPEDEQTEVDATASPKTESASETGDSDADPNYSLSDYSYSDTYDNKSSSFDEINVSTLNEPQNRDLTTKERKQEAEEQTKKQMEKNEIKMLRNTAHAYGSSKGGTKIPERKIRPPCRATFRPKCFSKFSEQERHVIFKTKWSLGDTNAQRILNLNVLMSYKARLESP